MTVKIERIELELYDLPLKQSFKTAEATISSRQCCLIQIWDDQGRLGLGETAPLPDFGTESYSAAWQALQLMQNNLVGSAVSSPQELLKLLANLSATPAVRHGLELAILDLLAQVANLPLARYLNFEATASVGVNAVLGMTSPDLTATAALALVQQGYTCLKLKVGDRDFDLDYARVKSVRQAVGEQIKIRLDANQAWTTDQAIRSIKKLEPFQIEYIEQPVRASDLIGMAEVKASVELPIAADEAANHFSSLDNIIKYKAADIVILKPMLLGGILSTRQAADRAWQSSLEVVLTTTLDGAIARLGCLHLAASLPKLQRECGIATGNLLVKDLPYSMPNVHFGKLALPFGTGLGYKSKYN